MELIYKIIEKVKIVQDADRIDALGAIGIARVFHYSGFINSKIYEEKTLLTEENLLNDIYYYLILKEDYCVFIWKNNYRGRRIIYFI